MDNLALGIRAVRFSNDVYGSEVAPSFELFMGCTKPFLVDIAPAPFLMDIAKAWDEIFANQKPTNILGSNCITLQNICTGDLVQVCIKHENEWRGKWSPPRIVLTIDIKAGGVRVPGSEVQNLRAAAEDVRAALIEDVLTVMLRERRDQLENDVEDLLDEEIEHDSWTFDGSHTGEDSTLDSPNLKESIEILWPLNNVYYRCEEWDVDESKKGTVR